MSNALLVGITSSTCYFLTAAVASAATILVPGDFATIQEAVFSAEDKDIILVAPGVHFGFLEEGVVDMLGKEISLLSTDGPQRTFIDGEFTRRGINCTSGETSNTIIDGFTIMSGVAFEGGGILCSGSSPTIRNCVFEECSASFGGAVRCTTVSSPVFEDCQFVGNFADFCGGAIACAFDSEITITRCEIIENFALSFGGGLFMELGCSANVSDSVISGNSTEFDGGGIWSSGSSGTFSNTEITDNFALNSAGGIYSESSSFELDGVLLSGNLAEFEGGALVAIQSDIDLIHSVLAQNSSFGKTQSSIVVDSESVVFAEETSFFGEEVDGTIAFGLCNEFFLNSKELLVVSQLRPTATFQSIQPAVNAASDGTLIVVMKGVYTDSGQEVVDMLGKQIVLNSTGNVDDVVIDGEGQRRGIVCQNGEPITTHIKGFTIRNCVTPIGEFVGAGIHCDASDATISCCKIVNNVADDAGGGIGSTNSGSQVVYDCLISQNDVLKNGLLGYGGGFYNSGGSPSITDCAITDNSARKGAGVYLDTCISPLISDTSITLNSIDCLEGGGVFLDECIGTPKIFSCTIQDNSAAQIGGGICALRTSFEVNDCSIVFNDAGRNGAGVHCERAFGSAPVVVLAGVLIQGNGAGEFGGGVFASGVRLFVEDFDSLVVAQGRVLENGALAGGGIHATDSAEVFLESVEVHGNTAFGNPRQDPGVFEGGGGIKCELGSSLSILDCSILGNEAFGDGGGVHVDNASAVIASTAKRPGNATQITFNVAKSGGGIFAMSSSLNLDGITFSGNIASDIGGGISFDGCKDTVIQSSIFHEGNSAGSGGAIALFNMTQVLEDLTIQGNIAENNGGGIFAEEMTLDIINLTIDDNTSSDRGGGIAIFGSDTFVTGAKVTNNIAENNGGGICIEPTASSASTVEIGTSSFIANTSTSGKGGGVSCLGNGLEETHVILPVTVFQNNSSGLDGGGLYVQDATLSVSGVVFEDNAVQFFGFGGAGCATRDANVTFTTCEFNRNQTVGDGGGIRSNGGEITFDSCDINENVSTSGDGGGVNAEDADVDLTDCVFNENTCESGNGGGMWAESSTIDCTNCDFSGNEATDGDGGGVFVRLTSLSITGGLIEENTCEAGDGGGVCFSASSEECFVDDVTFNDNSAERGGAIGSIAISNPTISECDFTGNTALTDGGAILSQAGVYSASDCTFSENLALATNGRGGAICNIQSDDSPEIENCTFTFNSAALGFGGAMAFDNEVSGSVVTGCTFTENGAARGGGMWANASSPSITDCVIESNSASEVGAVQSGGGGMHIRNEADPIVTNTTFLGNLAAARGGGGLFIDDDSDPQFFNCVIRKNDADLSDLDSGGGFLSRDKSFPMFTDCTICFNNPNQRTGIFVDGGGNVITDCGCPGACPADFNGDGIIDGGDIGILLSFWGFEGGKCSFDLNGDGIIDGGDLGLMLGLFGPCGAG